MTYEKCGFGVRDTPTSRTPIKRRAKLRGVAYHCVVATQFSDFGDALDQALTDSRMSQADLARALHMNASQVSRWKRGESVPNLATVERIEEFLQVDLSLALKKSLPVFELYVSAPITGLSKNEYSQHHETVARVVDELRKQVHSLFWPGETIRHLSELEAPTVATRRNLEALQRSAAFVYLQFAEVRHPTGSLIELGIALALKHKTTLFIQKDLQQAFMLENFGVVAAEVGYLPKAVVHRVADAKEACRQIALNGRDLLGLN